MNKELDMPILDAADTPYALAKDNQLDRNRRLSLLEQPHMLLLTEMIRSMRTTLGTDCQIPDFDPCDGGINARALFLLEAPGPQAINSGFVSRNNPDPTARNLCEMMTLAEIARGDSLLWNVVPWYLGDGKRITAASASNIADAFPYLKRLLGLLTKLEVIVLVGKKAQSAIPAIQLLTPVPFVKTHHPSARVFNVWPEKRAEAEASFREIASILKA